MPNSVCIYVKKRFFGNSFILFTFSGKYGIIYKKLEKRRKGSIGMKYPILGLDAQSASEAAVKLHFALATEHFRGEEFLRVDFLCEPQRLSSLRGAVLRVLRERKKAGKIRFFLPSEDLTSEKPEAAFVANKYPALLEDTALLGAENACILVKL